jgi:hypothetical protein
MIKLTVVVCITALVFLTTACQPGKAVKKDEIVPVDSVLYFEQKDLDDPFLDTVFDQPDQPVTIEKKLVPPPVPPAVPPRFREIEGFRVQVFAGLDSVNALPVLDQASALTGDSIYYFEDNGLFKIQIGDYQFRYKADSARTYLRQNGFTGAWVVQRPILIPVSSDTLALFAAGSDTLQKAAGLIGDPNGRFKIQIMALADEAKARLTAAALRSDQNYNAFYEQSGSLYKLFVGYFNSEERAREVLEQLRENGYPDAWLVY